MRFLADRTEAHGTGNEPFHDFFRRFHLFDRDGFLFFESQEVTEEDGRFLFVHHSRIFLEFLVTSQTGCQLQGRDSFRVPGMFLTVFPETVNTFVFQHAVYRLVECLVVHSDRIACNLVQADATDVAGRTAEISACQFRIQADCFEQFGSPVTADSTDPHFAHDFKQSFTDGFYIILTGRFIV